MIFWLLAAKPKVNQHLEVDSTQAARFAGSAYDLELTRYVRSGMVRVSNYCLMGNIVWHVIIGTAAD